MLESEWLDSSVKRIPLFFSFGGSLIALYQYTTAFPSLFALKETSLGRSFYTFLNRNGFLIKCIMNESRHLFYVLRIFMHIKIGTAVY